MTRLAFIPLILAGCATCPPEAVICDEYARCVCEGAPGAIAALDRIRDDNTRTPPQRTEPTQPEQPEPEQPEMREPSRDDYDSEKDYREAHDDWKDGRG